MAERATSGTKVKAVSPCGLASVDGLAGRPNVTLEDYIAAVAHYVRSAGELDAKQKKAGQIRLSNALARAFAIELGNRLGGVDLHAGEKSLAGALRTAKADVSEFHELDGVRLAVELKPVNLAVGRAIWNRFGDIRAFAVNVHLKFPFAIVGGVLVLPTYEEKKEKDGTVTKKSTVHLIKRLVGRLVRACGFRKF